MARVHLLLRKLPTAAWLLSAAAGFNQYLGLSLGADAMAAVVTSTTDLAISPPFNNPYASTSRECAAAIEIM